MASISMAAHTGVDGWTALRRVISDLLLLHCTPAGFYCIILIGGTPIPTAMHSSELAIS